MRLRPLPEILEARIISLVPHATGRTSSATRPASPSCKASRSVPIHCGRSPTVAARTGFARSGSRRYAEHTSVSNRFAINATTFISVSAGFPPSLARVPSSAKVNT